MDTIALLCTMHADGPATLRILRRAGLHTISDVALARPERVADVLGVSPAFARRFAREARNLGERVGAVPSDALEALDPLDIEEGDDDEARAVSDAAATKPAGAAEPAARGGTRRQAGEGAADGVGSGRSTQRQIEDDALAADLRARILPESGLRLHAGLIPDLDAALCERLIAQGVRTLEALADAPGLELARRLGIPYARWLDLQCLARHRWKSATAPPRRAAPREEHDPESLYTLFPASSPDAHGREREARGSHGRIEARRVDVGAIDVGGPFV